MKWMFISDIHGIKTNLPKIKEKMEEYQCDKLVVLGDIYYLGPRNHMYEDHDIPYVKNFLDSYKDKIICMRGNCDSEVDIEVSSFPIMRDLSMVSINGLELYLTHGHIYHEDHWNKENSILIYGHKHVPFIKEKGSNLFINPGSISMPRDGFPPSYMLFDGEEFTIYDIDDNILAQRKIS